MVGPSQEQVQACLERESKRLFRLLGTKANSERSRAAIVRDLDESVANLNLMCAFAWSGGGWTLMV